MHRTSPRNIGGGGLWAIVMVVMIGYLGTAMPYPIFAPLFLGGGSRIARSSVLSPILLYSLLMAIYPFGTLLGSLCLGPLSDRVGRKRIILVTTVVAIGANSTSGYAIIMSNYLILFIGRFLTGLCEGNISVARAALTDLDLKNELKALSFGYLSTASYVAYLVGPLLGGVLSYYLGFSIPFFFAAALSGLSAIACSAYVDGSCPPCMGEAGSRSSSPGGLSYRWPASLWKLPAIKLLLFVQFLITLTINVYHEFFPILLVKKAHANSIDISVATIVATSTMISVSLGGMSALLRRWGIGKSFLWSTVMIGVSISLFAIPDELGYIYPVFVVFGGSLAIFNGSSTGWFANAYAAANQGKLMGVVGSMFFLSNIVAATLGGLVANYSVDLLMLLAGGVAIVAGCCLSIGIRRAESSGVR